MSKLRRGRTGGVGGNGMLGGPLGGPREANMLRGGGSGADGGRADTGTDAPPEAGEVREGGGGGGGERGVMPGGCRLDDDGPGEACGGNGVEILRRCQARSPRSALDFAACSGRATGVDVGDVVALLLMPAIMAPAAAPPPAAAAAAVVGLPNPNPDPDPDPPIPFPNGTLGLGGTAPSPSPRRHCTAELCPASLNVVIVFPPPPAPPTPTPPPPPPPPPCLTSPISARNKLSSTVLGLLAPPPDSSVGVVGTRTPSTVR